MQYEANAGALTFHGELRDGILAGTTVDGQGRPVRWSGRPAPGLARTGPIMEAVPIDLIRSEELADWRLRDPSAANCWNLNAGVLSVTPPCVDLITEETFDDFLLHLEFMYPAGSNSGVYLRGRYEVQIQDDAGRALDPLRMGAIYGFLTPSTDAAGAAGTWQTLDLELRGRVVTVTLNGERIIDRREIAGITGGALDSDEGSPGPIMLQGDHGPVSFRNIVVTPLL